MTPFSPRIIFPPAAARLLAAVLLAVLLALASTSQAADDPETAFKEGWHAFQALTKDEQRAGIRTSWFRVEDCFLRSLKVSSTGEYAAKSLFYLGRVYEELGNRSFVKGDHLKAVDYYQRLALRFPEHTWTDDGLLRKAKIELERLDQRDQAYEDLVSIVRGYPKGDMAPEAQKLLEKLGMSKPLPPVQPSAPQPQPAEARQAEQEPQSPPPASAQDASQAAAAKAAPKDGPFTLTGVRHQSSSDYTRVTIEVDGEATYKYQLLDPHAKADRSHRLYVDLLATHVGQGVPSSSDVGDGILKDIRIGQFDQKTARVVLDVHAMQKYNIFTMQDPYRVVIDVSAPPKSGAEAKTAAQAPPVDEKAAAQARPEPEKPAKAGKKSAAKDAAKEPAKAEAKDTGKPEPKESAKAGKAEAQADPAAEDDGAKQGGKKGRNIPKPEKYTPPAGSKKFAGDLIEQLGLTVNTIMLDAGHGGKDPGAMANGLYEKDVVLSVTKLVGEKLKAKGFNVLYTRTSDNFVPLEDRTAMANVKKADMFVSVHCNAHSDEGIHGLETYSLNLARTRDAVRVAARENATSAKRISDLQVILSDLMLNSKVRESKDLAGNVQACVLGAAKPRFTPKDMGTREAPFYVLMGAKMPAVLIEVGYLTNSEEAKLLGSRSYQECLADGIVQGILKYKKQIERYASR